MMFEQDMLTKKEQDILLGWFSSYICIFLNIYLFLVYLCRIWEFDGEARSKFPTSTRYNTGLFSSFVFFFGNRFVLKLDTFLGTNFFASFFLPGREEGRRGKGDDGVKRLSRLGC